LRLKIVWSKLLAVILLYFVAGVFQVRVYSKGVSGDAINIPLTSLFLEREYRWKVGTATLLA
jgi:hypothetical protein